MKKVVKLTESDLVNLIKKVVKEQTKTLSTNTISNLSNKKRCGRPQTTTSPETGDTICNTDQGWYAGQSPRTCVCYGT